MKKSKSLICIVLLSVCLVSNAFGGSFFNGGILSFFDEVVKVVASSLMDDPDNCPLRQCTNCRPGRPNCRPSGE